MHSPFAVYAQIQDWTAYKCVVSGVQTVCDCTVDGVPTLKCLEIVIGNVLYVASVLVLLILFIMFIVGSFTYMSSGGDKEKVEKARHTFTYAIFGMLLFIGSYLILRIIDTLFLGGTGTIFRFEIPEFR